MITISLLIIACICNAIMDSIMSNDTFKGLGLWFSRDGWKVKHAFVIWLNKYLPLWLSKFIAEDVLVVFTDLWHLSKAIMILCFCLAITFTLTGVIIWIGYSILFSLIYVIIR